MSRFDPTSTTPHAPTRAYGRSSRRPYGLPLVLALFLAACAPRAGTVVTEPAPPVAAPTTRPAEPEPVAVEETVPAMPAGLDTVRAGRFDYGKMWTFDSPPVAYFRETYGFDPNTAWFEKARLGALRIPGCTASFVSPGGLVMTNHHCAREHVVAVTRPGENLLDDGFYARSMEEERAIPEMYAEQLIRITDVTDEVNAAAAGGQTDAERISAREEAVEAIQTRIGGELGGEEAGITVQVVTLYNGGRYSAYVFRRYEDVRLVMAPSVDIAFFGGDPDNFTYPRYDLDMSFLRVYEDDRPLRPSTHFEWSENGAREGEAVFVVGNPGSTSRLSTVSQLEYRRDVEDRLLRDVFQQEIGLLEEYARLDPEAADSLDLRNTIFSIENALKAREGIIGGLDDPFLLARRRDAERQFRERIEADPNLKRQYATLLDDISALQGEGRELAPQYRAFIGYNPSSIIGSAVLKRALYGYFYARQLASGVPADRLADLKQTILDIDDRPARIEERAVAIRLRAIRDNLGADSEVARAVLQGRTPEDAARELVRNTALTDSARFARMLDGNLLQSGDPAVRFAEAIAQPFVQFQQQLGGLGAREQELAGQLGRARFEVYGTDVPPDATFSLRIADGVVAGYPYNGTMAPAFTTFYGLYDRYYSFNRQEPWKVPEEWEKPPASFDLSTPFNLVSTNDIIGGNSGSPLLNRDLEVVGLVFDGNIESLPGEFIYTSDRARTVSVDSRAIVEALDEIYDADRLVLELRQGRVVETEAEADRILR